MPYLHGSINPQRGNDRGDVLQLDLADGFLPMAGKMCLFSAALNPEMDLVTHSADLNANHCLATYSKVRTSLRRCGSILAGSVSERIKASLSFRLKTTALSGGIGGGILFKEPKFAPLGLWNPVDLDRRK